MPPHLRRPGPGGRGAGPGQPDDFAQHMRVFIHFGTKEFLKETLAVVHLTKYSVSCISS